MNIEEKYNLLKNNLLSLGKVAVAYSGGVDSTFLLKAAVDILGSENVLACMGVSASLAANQKIQGRQMAEAIGAKLVEINVAELSDAGYTANKADRCFHCKSHLYDTIGKIAHEKGFEHTLCGSNFDDKDDYRPGNRAAQVFNVHSPLMDAELAKDDIRTLSRQFKLATADVPASPCLSSRISYGLEITEQRLEQVEKAEDFLRTLGFVKFRVRHHGDIARIETTTQDFDKLNDCQTRDKITEKLKSLGFKFITIDLQGFRTGSLNEVLSEQEKQKNL